MSQPASSHFPSPPSRPSASQAPSDEALAELTRTLAASAADYDRSGNFPHANFELLQRLGLLGLAVPEELGGAGIDLAKARRIISAVAKGEPSTALILTMQYLHHFRLQLDRRWPEALRRRVAEDALRDGALINSLRVEPELGSPIRGGLPGTVARRTPDGWRLTGRKIYSTGSHGLTWLLVWAASDDDDPLVGGYLVHKDTPGVRIVDDWDHLGMRATASHEVRFEDAPVPLNHAVTVSRWSEPKAELDPQSLLWMSVLLTALYDGIAQAARDWLVEFLNTRTPANLGAPLASLPRFQDLLGRIDTLLFNNQSLLDSATQGLVAPDRGLQVKQIGTGNAIRAVELAIEAIGNPGLTRKNPLERHYRDVLCGRVHNPQDDVTFGVVGRGVLNRAVGTPQ